jgi:antitoxin component of MazEF toxin-antitoxin module
MRTRIVKLGESLAVRIPARMANELGLTLETKVPLLDSKMAS